MVTQDVTLHLPDSLYQRLKQRADQARHSVEDESGTYVAKPPADTRDASR